MSFILLQHWLPLSPISFFGFCLYLQLFLPILLHFMQKYGGRTRNNHHLIKQSQRAKYSNVDESKEDKRLQSISTREQSFCRHVQLNLVIISTMNFTPTPPHPTQRKKELSTAYHVFGDAALDLERE